MFSNITIDDLIENVKKYIKDEDKTDVIYAAYDYADEIHKNVKRQGGEDYITHPLSVALILSELGADEHTIAAALLHDSIEDDENIEKEDIITLFESFGDFSYKDRKFNIGEYIASLVEGVTNIEYDGDIPKEEQDARDIKKILSCTDIRVILIKLADRLHNMRTLGHMSKEKQIKKAKETMEFYVPLARNIGLYRIEQELEDISLRYLDSTMYQSISNRVIQIKDNASKTIENMIKNIKAILAFNGINLEKEIVFKTKSINEIYNDIKDNKDLSKTYDLLELTVVVGSIPDCYTSICYIHSLYKPANISKDFIASPKTNMYQSYHTTVIVDGYLVQLKIRTLEMDKVASLGLAAFWQDENINMDDEAKKLCFFQTLQNNVGSSNIDTLKYLKNVLGKKMYIKSTGGSDIEVPVDSTIESYIRSLDSETIDSIKAVTINGSLVSPSYKLQPGDVIDIIRDNFIIPRNLGDLCEGAKEKKKE
jgi:GTP pyrophosphokinase